MIGLLCIFVLSICWKMLLQMIPCTKIQLNFSELLILYWKNVTIIMKGLNHKGNVYVCFYIIFNFKIEKKNHSVCMNLMILMLALISFLERHWVLTWETMWRLPISEVKVFLWNELDSNFTQPGWQLVSLTTEQPSPFKIRMKMFIWSSIES